MALVWLKENGPPHFPATRDALSDPSGLLAVGGNLDSEWLIAAYQRGIFPWYSASEPILWWSPTPRCVFPPGAIHISRRLRRRMRQLPGLRIRIGTDFDRVIEQCALVGREGQPGTWITTDMMAAYQRLHRLGYATAVSVWSAHAMIGGLYGVSLGSVFYGESMVSRQPDGSKIALAAVDFLMRKHVWQLLDAQVASPHLLRMGAELWPRDRFEAMLPQKTDCPDRLALLPEELDVDAFLQDVAS